MSSIIEGFNYDIFISYRQKDNKGDRWVSEFVDSLKTELESTFKEEISVYFDVNPHDGLLETHDVDASLKEKLKCLIFIPIISRTYCDTKSFAWEHEFKAFVDLASKDQFGMKIKLPNGNVANRVLPVRIHDLDSDDIKECESVLGGFLRGIEFIYKEPGVNKPLATDDDEKKNFNKVRYRIQINKTANAIKEIISGLRKEPYSPVYESKHTLPLNDNSQIQEKSIVVLPFQNISPDPEQEYFSDGLTEEIINNLSHIHELLVISRSSAMTLKGTKKKIAEIASEVNVHYVLEGSVRKSGNNLRITAQLIDGINDSHIWAEKYHGTLEDIFDIQQKVAQSIVEALKIKLVPEEKQKILARPIDNFQLYDFHIRVQKAMAESTEDGLQRAIQYVNKGLEILGENEVLYCDLGQVYIFFAEIGIDKSENIFKKAEECTDKIFSLNPDSANAYYLKGHINRWRGNIKESIKDLRKALAIDPNHFYATFYLSFIYYFSGKAEAARPIVQRLMKIDPLNSWSYFLGGVVEILDGNFIKSVGLLRNAYKLEPTPHLKWWIAKGLAYNNEWYEACELLKSVVIESPGTHWAQIASFFMYALQGEKSKALEVVTDELLDMMKDDEMYTLWTAESYALIGDKEKSLEWIEKGLNSHFINYPFLSAFDPFFVDIREDQQFAQLMERVKYEWENFEV